MPEQSFFLLCQNKGPCWPILVTCITLKIHRVFLFSDIGPMLSSGMCTEVFQFDVSPSTGAIVPITSIANVSTENRQNANSVKKTRNRRSLHELPEPLNGVYTSSLNITEEQVKNLQKDHLHANKSSMVVSALVDPREVGDGDVDGMMRPKSLSWIIVVVLIDSVKYVTY